MIVGFLAFITLEWVIESHFDAFLRKYDAQGNPLWTRQFGNENNDFADSVMALKPSKKQTELGLVS